jgi:hypothetical protein
MATYEQISVKRNDSTLITRFVVAVEIAAAMVFGEDPATEHHAERLLWAKRAFLVENRSQEYATRVMRLAMAFNANIADLVIEAQITDQQIQGVVDSYVTPLALAGI